MAISRGELKAQVLRLLMKSSAFPGFYDELRINDAIQESLDFVAVEMFLADEGWLTKLWHITTTAGQISVDLPADCAMIKEIRYKYGTDYVPVAYDTANGEIQSADDSGMRQYTSNYRLIDNAIYFNPPVAEGSTDYLQIEGFGFPTRLQNDSQFIDSQFNFALSHYLKYRSASILAASIEKFATPWANLEAQWFKKMQEIVVSRNRQSIPIRDFCG